MNLFKNLSSMFFGSKEPKVEVNGSFFSLDKESKEKCLLLNSKLQIVQNPQPFSSKIIVTRIVEEGEEVDAEEQSTYEFDINAAMQVQSLTGPSENPAFSWFNVFHGKRYMFEFDSDEVQNFGLTLTILSQAIYENKFQQDHSSAAPETLVAFISKASNGKQPTPVTSPQQESLYPKLDSFSQNKTPITSPLNDSINNNNNIKSNQSTPMKSTMTPKNISSSTSTPSSGKKIPQGFSPVTKVDKVVSPSVNSNNNTPEKISLSPQKDEPSRLPPVTDMKIEGETVFEKQADIFLYNDRSGSFIKLFDNITALVNYTNPKEYEKKLYLLDSTKRVFLSQILSQNMYMNFYEDEKSGIWVYSCIENGQIYTFSLNFKNNDDFSNFKDIFARAVVEYANKQPFEKTVSKDDVDYISKSFNKLAVTEDDDDMLELIDPNEEDELEREEEEEEIEQSEEEKEEVDEDDEDDDEDEGSMQYSKGAKNSLLATGQKIDQHYVVRGSSVGVFKNKDSKMKYQTRINNIKDKEGNYFTPSKMMTHEGDTSLMFLNGSAAKNKSIYKVDLNRPDVIQEFKTNDNYSLNDILPTSKFAQMSDESSLLGINKLGIMYLDPRQKQMAVESRSHYYNASSKPNITCGATTADGDMVVGTGNGDIRLFNANSVSGMKKDSLETLRAKSSISGFGDEVIGIDTTKDGLWIIATYRTYIMLSKTEAIDDKGKSFSGFDKSLGRFKDAPIRLQLKTEDIKSHLGVGKVINFTPAKFSRDVFNEEKSIVTSTGPFVITWNFQKIKQGKGAHYEIKKYKDDIVADQFRFADENSIIVTLPDNVTMAQRGVVKKFETPQKSGTPFRN